MSPSALLAALVGAALLGAAALKLADRTATALAAETFGVRGSAARWAWLPLAALEAGLAVALIARPNGAGAAAAAVLLTTFAVAQAIAIAAGRSGAPCGCFGARGQLSWGSAARAALLAAGAALLATAPAPAADAPPPTLVGLAALALAAVVAGRARRPRGALEVAGEGPPHGSRLDFGNGARLALFVAGGCRLCRTLVPRARQVGAAIFDEVADADMWAAAGVPGAPYAVVLADDGSVLAKGTVNTRAQLDSLRGAAAHRAREPASSRRTFLQTASGAVAAITAGRMVGSLVAPGDADAFHFCGHIYTTDGCPHPTGLPRIDRNGYPLRARDARPVDDLGRLIDAVGAPIDEAGAPLLDPDGRPQPPATRTRVCVAAGRRFGIAVRTDGAWYRCCNGHVRKLVDCCTTSTRRINGDRGLRGYCYGRRRVFCVMYFQTKVPC